MTQLILPLVAQRWRDRRGSYRPQGEPIDTGRYGVERVEYSVAKRFVERHHYAGSYVASIAEYGLWRARELVGVCAFSVPMNGAAVAKWAGEGAWGCEVGRFVLLDDVEANGETWFLARAAALFGADKPEHALALAYSDPMPRVDGAGRLVFRGHYGGIYQSRSCAYLGRGRARLLWIAHDGAVISERALSKLRNGERGARYAYEQLVAKAAPRIRPGEDERIYADRALVEGPFRRMRHRGNHVYAFRLPGAPRALGRALDRGLPYPKLTDRPELL